MSKDEYTIALITPAPVFTGLLVTLFSPTLHVSKIYDFGPHLHCCMAFKELVPV